MEDRHVNDYISITEMARWQNITTETLRHYDRIGLLKPAYINEHGKRFYSPQQYELLGTIRDLSQRGVELNEIADYLNDRTLENSRKLLHLQKSRLRLQIEKLQNMLTMIDGQSEVLDAISEDDYRPDIRMCEFPQRYYLMSSLDIHDAYTLAAGCHELEDWFRASALGKRIPTYATNVFAAMWQTDNLASCKGIFISRTPFDALRQSSDLTLGVLPEGQYLCVRHTGSLWNVKAGMEPLLAYLDEHNFKAATDWAVDCVVVDWTVTSHEDERLYDLQLPLA